MDKKDKTRDSRLPENEVTRREFISRSAALAASVTLVGAGGALFSSCGRGDAPLYFDTLIKDGTIYDGSTGAPFVGDVGIIGDRIAAIGDLAGRAGRIIDAAGLIVTPGFVDVHTHCDLTFQRSGWKKNLAYVLPSFRGNYNYLYQGVTTVVTGNCGNGYAEVGPWLDTVGAVGFGTNVYHLVPHGSTRLALFGEDQPAALSIDQMDLLKAQIAEAMEAGAVGMSCGLEYFPGFLSATDELVELGRVVAARGGVFTIHMRDESGAAGPTGNWALVDSIREAVAIAERADVSVQISHLKASVPYNGISTADFLPLIEDARARGLAVAADQYPYDAGSSHAAILMPNQLVHGENVKDSYRTADGRKEVRRAIGEVYSYLPPEKIMISMMYDGNPDYEGKTIAEIAEMENKDPADVYVELVCDTQAPVSIFFMTDMKIVKEIARQEYVFTASDAWTVPKGITMPHPRAYGTFPKKIREFALAEKVINLPTAIRSMTSLPASKFGLSGRGTIQPGAFADVAVINLDTIADHATYLDPHQYATGVQYLMVNGILAIEGGSATGLRGGRPCRRS